MGKKKQTSSKSEKSSKAQSKPEAQKDQLPADDSKAIRIHYYVKIIVSTFLCALLLLIGVPVFMESRVTGSLAYTALGVVLVAFGLILALAVVILLFNPPFKARINK